MPPLFASICWSSRITTYHILSCHISHIVKFKVCTPFCARCLLWPTKSWPSHEPWVGPPSPLTARALEQRVLYWMSHECMDRVTNQILISLNLYFELWRPKIFGRFSGELRWNWSDSGLVCFFHGVFVAGATSPTCLCQIYPNLASVSPKWSK